MVLNFKSAMNNRMRMCIQCFFLIAVVILLLATIASSRNSKDNWALSGIELPFAVCSLAFAFFIFVSKRPEHMLLGVATFSAVLGLIPSMKYAYVYGTFDSAAHYGVVTDIVNTGRIPSSGFYSSEYSYIPGMHIMISALALAASINIEGSIRILIFSANFLLPLFAYFGIKPLLSKSDISLRAIVLSAFVGMPPLYYLGGTLFGIIFFAFICYAFIRLETIRKHGYSIAVIIMIVGFSLIISHGFSSLYLILSLFLVWVAAQKLARKKLLPTFLFLSLVCLFALWWGYQAVSYPLMIWKILLILLGEDIVHPPQGFSMLSLQGQFSAATAVGLRYIIASILIALGLIVYFRSRHRLKHSTKRLVTLGLLFSILSPILIIAAFQKLKVESYTYTRFLDYTLIFTPLLCSLILTNLDKIIINPPSFTTKRLSSFLFLLPLIVATSFSVYPISPLIPQKDAPIVIFDYNYVNSEYKVRTIRFVGDHYVYGDIQSDRETRWQIAGFARPLVNSWVPTAVSNRVTFKIFQTGSKAGPYSVTEESFRQTQHSIERDTVVYQNGQCTVTRAG